MKTTMIRKAAIAVMITLVLGGTVSAVAPAGTVALVYSGRSSVNRHAVDHIAMQARRQRGGVRLELVEASNARNLRADGYSAAILLNTGQQSGIDPRLSAVIDSNGGDVPVMTVNLYRGRRSTDVETNGVDAVTAASVWSERGGRSNPVRVMHDRWSSMAIEWASHVVGSN